jgi:hypothetical protein
MIYGQRNACRTAILAAVTISPQDILTRKNYLLKRHPNIRRKPNDARKRHRNRSGMHRFARHAGHEFRFIQIEQNDRFFDTGNGKRLVIAIQNEYFPAKLRVGWTIVLIVIGGSK